MCQKPGHKAVDCNSKVTKGGETITDKLREEVEKKFAGKARGKGNSWGARAVGEEGDESMMEDTARCVRDEESGVDLCFVLALGDGDIEGITERFDMSPDGGGDELEDDYAPPGIEDPMPDAWIDAASTRMTPARRADARKQQKARHVTKFLDMGCECESHDDADEEDHEQDSQTTGANPINPTSAATS